MSFSAHASIVICTFRRPGPLEALIASLAVQVTDALYEIVVVDNDPASRCCDDLKLSYPAIRWVEEPRQGLSFARNTGIHAARGDIIVFLDDDMEVGSGWLQALVAAVVLEGYDVACGPVTPVKLETESERLFEAYGSHGHASSLAVFDGAWLRDCRFALPLWQVGGIGNSAVRRSAFQRARGGEFEEALGAGTPAGSCEDLYFLYKLLRANGSVTRHPSATVRHAHRGTMSGLTTQLCAYRRGEVAFCLLLLLRHGDMRGLSHLCLWIPAWRIRLFAQEINRRLHGQRLFPFSLMLREMLAYLVGPFALIRSMQRAARLRSAAGTDDMG